MWLWSDPHCESIKPMEKSLTINPRSGSILVEIESSHQLKPRSGFIVAYNMIKIVGLVNNLTENIVTLSF